MSYSPFRAIDVTKCKIYNSGDGERANKYFKAQISSRCLYCSNFSTRPAARLRRCRWTVRPMSSQSSSRRRAEPTRSLFNLYSSESHQDHLQQDVKPILASSIKVASMGAWELPNSKSPALYAPPDMNSECLLRHIYNALFQVDNID